MVGNLANIAGRGPAQRRPANRARTAEQLADANVQLQQAEEAMRRSDRLAALGQLSAGLAHELRNPLGTIRASAEMLSRSCGRGKRSGARNGGLHRLRSGPRQLADHPLSAIRPAAAAAAREKADLAQTLDRAVALVEREAPGIAIYKNYAPEIPPFPFDAELLERVFYNLMLNAAQATPGRRRGHA